MQNGDAGHEGNGGISPAGAHDQDAASPRASEQQPSGNVGANLPSAPLPFDGGPLKPPDAAITDEELAAARLVLAEATRRLSFRGPGPKSDNAAAPAGPSASAVRLICP